MDKEIRKVDDVRDDISKIDYQIALEFITSAAVP